MQRIALAIATLAALLVTGCGSTPDRGAAFASARLAAAHVEVPDGGQAAVLKLSGRIGRITGDRQLRLSDSTLAGLAPVEVELYEPFERRRMRFEAIPMRDLLALAGVKDGATTLKAVALNDYVVDLPLDVMTRDGVYLAIRNGDGSPIAVENGGPIRVVFDDRAAGAAVEAYWIWSLATLAVR